jgi:hypothetical protein
MDPSRLPQVCGLVRLWQQEKRTFTALLHADASNAGVCRRVLLQALCAAAAAYELGPSTQGPSEVTSLWTYISRLLQGALIVCLPVCSFTLLLVPWRSAFVHVAVNGIC